MHFLGFTHRKLPLLCHVTIHMWILAQWLFYKLYMIPSAMICLGMIEIEVFEWKISFLRVLDCHSSPRRANGSRGELEGQMGVSTRLLLAMASRCSPPTHNHSPWRANSGAAHCLFASGWFWRFASGSFQAIFLSYKPSIMIPGHRL
jgi:hypothetical protein